MVGVREGVMEEVMEGVGMGISHKSVDNFPCMHEHLALTHVTHWHKQKCNEAS